MRLMRDVEELVLSLAGIVISAYIGGKLNF